MLKDNTNNSLELDSGLLMTIVSKYLGRNYKDRNLEFTFHEVAELYWIFSVCEIYPTDPNSEILKPLETILNDLLALLIIKHKPLSEVERFDGHEQEMEFREEDADVVIFYYENLEQVGGSHHNHKQIINTIESIRKKYDDRPENERKWFVF